jgi:hypothetical protein
MTDDKKIRPIRKGRSCTLTEAEPWDRVYNRGYRIGSIRPTRLPIEERFKREHAEEVFEGAAEQFDSD